MKNSTGIFRTLPTDLVKRERAAAIRFNKSLDGIAEACYHHFFRRLTQSERRLAFDKVPTKKMGRKVK